MREILHLQPTQKLANTIQKSALPDAWSLACSVLLWFYTLHTDLHLKLVAAVIVLHQA